MEIDRKELMDKLDDYGCLGVCDDTYYYIVFSADAIVRIREKTWDDKEVDRKLFRRSNFFKKIDDAILVGELLGKSFDKYLMIVKTKDNGKEI